MFRAFALSLAVFVGAASATDAGAPSAAFAEGSRGAASWSSDPQGYRSGTSGLRSNARSNGANGYLRDGRRSTFAHYGGYAQRNRSFYYRGTGIYANAAGPGFVATGTDYAPLELGPKIIDVAASRLDRQPMPRSGISVRHVGVAKIIRIAPDYDASRQHPAQRSVEARPRDAERVAVATPRPLPRAYQPPVAALRDRPEPAVTAAPAPAASTAASTPAPAVALEPWTDAWLRDCVARHPNFDASLGTYADENGRRRFCTGDQG